MNQISFDELRLIQLEILRRVDEYCVKNKLQYSLAYGTLIGAVRHKGYIPWDDDIDIMMQRKDYDLFLSGFNEANSDLKVVSPQTVSSYYAPYANVYLTNTKLVEPHVKHGFADLGVKIDVFPVDFVPSDYDKYSKMVVLSRNLNKWRNYKVMSIFNGNGEKSLKALIKKIISFFIPFVYLNIRTTKMIKGNNDPTGFEDIIIWPVYPYRRFSEALFKETIRVPFENIEVSIAKGYDGILTSIYGSYMELPPIEKRVAKHDFIAYWKD